MIGNWQWSLLLLGSVLSAVTGYRALPPLLAGLRPTWIRAYFEALAPAEALLTLSDDARHLLARLEERTFARLGVKVEKFPLWGPSYRELALASANYDAYASVVLKPGGQPPALYFYTPFDPPGFVLTAGGETALQIEREDFSIRWSDIGDLDGLLAAHHEEVARFGRKGYKPSVGLSKEARVDATQRFYLCSYRTRALNPISRPASLVFLFSLALAIVGGLLVILPGPPLAP